MQFLWRVLFTVLFFWVLLFLGDLFSCFINSFVLSRTFCFLITFLIFLKNIFCGPILTFWKLWTKVQKLGSTILKIPFCKQVLQSYFESCLIFWFSIFSRIYQIVSFRWSMQHKRYAFLLNFLNNNGFEQDIWIFKMHMKYVSKDLYKCYSFL